MSDHGEVVHQEVLPVEHDAGVMHQEETPVAVPHGESEDTAHGDAHAAPAHAVEHAPAHGDAAPAHGEAAATGHGEAAAHGDAAAAHGGGHEGGGGAVPELENAIDYILLGARAVKTGESITKDNFLHNLHAVHNTVLVGKEPPPGEKPGQMTITWLDTINITYAFIAILILTLTAIRVKSKLKKIPTGFQSLVEIFVKGMDNYVGSILGHQSRAFLPFIGTIFIYILTMNYMGLFPGFKAPVALNLNVPAGIAICVFFLVQYHGIKQNGIGNYVKHFIGEPLWLGPLTFPLHIIGELAKPLTLTLRLFGNITGEDVVIAALVGLTSGMALFIPIPLQVLFYPLAMLFGLIQAIVFATLSAVYILLMSPHEEHH